MKNRMARTALALAAALFLPDYVHAQNPFAAKWNISGNCPGGRCGGCRSCTEAFDRFKADVAGSPAGPFFFPNDACGPGGANYPASIDAIGNSGQSGTIGSIYPYCEGSGVISSAGSPIDL